MAALLMLTPRSRRDCRPGLIDGSGGKQSLCAEWPTAKPAFGRLLTHAGALLAEEGLGGAVQHAGTPARRGPGGAVHQARRRHACGHAAGMAAGMAPARWLLSGRKEIPWRKTDNSTA